MLSVKTTSGNREDDLLCNSGSAFSCMSINTIIRVRLSALALTICKFCVLAPLRKHKTLHACHQSSSHTLLQQLHWLCIKYRVNFKIANITFRTLNSFQSTYLRIHCLSCSSVHSLLQVFQHQSALRSIRTHFTRRPQPQCRRP